MSDRIPAGLLLWRRWVPRFRACWHILRGHRVVYGVSVSGGQWSDEGWNNALVFVGCPCVAEFTVNGTPAIELRDRFGDVVVKPVTR